MSELLNAFLARNRKVRPLVEELPLAEVRRLGALGPEATASVAALLELAGFAGAYDFTYPSGRNAYDGQDLRAIAVIVRALGEIHGEAAETVPFLAARLAANVFDRHYAAPGGSDADKYDRDADLERAQDALAHECVTALTAFVFAAAKASPALEKAKTTHRSALVRRDADRLLGLLQRRAGQMNKPPQGWPRIASVLFYDDVAAAIAWICRAFAFDVRRKVEGEGGQIALAELVFGEGLILVRSAVSAAAGMASLPCRSPRARGSESTQALWIQVDDVNLHCHRARAAGATILQEPAPRDHGDEHGSERTYCAQDLEGHVWCFVQRERDAPRTRI